MQIRVAQNQVSRQIRLNSVQYHFWIFVGYSKFLRKIVEKNDFENISFSFYLETAKKRVQLKYLSFTRSFFTPRIKTDFFEKLVFRKLPGSTVRFFATKI